MGYLSHDDLMYRDEEKATVTRNVRVAAATQLERPFLLAVVEGPDRGQRFVVNTAHAGPFLIGTGPACHGRLTDSSVSRRHCAVEMKAQRLRVRDMQSFGGTFVDGISAVEVQLAGGELIRIGGTAFTVELGAARPRAHEPTADRFGLSLGVSPAMRRIYPLCSRLASSNQPLVIEGESGVGKEQLAESFHQMGPRSSGPFVVFDCGAVDANLVEAKLFGHVETAFSGAAPRSRKGVLEEADAGTLFIRAVDEMPLDVQAKLLEAIDKQHFLRVGGKWGINVDVRVVVGSRRNLDQMVQVGSFEQRLFDRLAPARVELPPLRERDGDVEFLAQHFWVGLGGSNAGPPREALRRWQDYGWPSNVRELRTAVSHRLALEAPLGPQAKERVPLDDAIQAALNLDLTLANTRQRIQAEVERRYIKRLLESNGGDVAKAAAAAGTTQREFQRLMRIYESR